MMNNSITPTAAKARVATVTPIGDSFFSIRVSAAPRTPKKEIGNNVVRMRRRNGFSGKTRVVASFIRVSPWV